MKNNFKKLKRPMTLNCKIHVGSKNVLFLRMKKCDLATAADLHLLYSSVIC